MAMPEFNKAKDTHASLSAAQGVEVDDSDAERLADAIDLAFDYRGDVTIVRHGETKPVEGYIFDRRRNATLADSALRMIPRGSDDRVTIGYGEIARLQFSGRDTAAGKSFETWMKKYVQKKLEGQEASIHSEKLDDA